MTLKLSIGDNVRITKKKKIFDKGYTQRWTKEVYKISKIQLTIPVTNKITDYNGQVIQGSFYEEELQKSSQSTFRIQYWYTSFEDIWHKIAYITLNSYDS